MEEGKVSLKNEKNLNRMQQIINTELVDDVGEWKINLQFRYKYISNQLMSSRS